MGFKTWELRREAAIPKWQSRIKECRTSGLSVKEWCTANGIERSTYYKWESLCLARASEDMTENDDESTENPSLIRINPALLPSQEENITTSTTSTEMVIHCGCVSMDISSQMPVPRIAELVRALNSHV